jgi:hypothetical protein
MKHISNYLKSSTLNLIILSLLLLLGLILIFFAGSNYTSGDNLSHYFAAHYGWKYAYLLFDNWSKPVFTILSSPFAQFGLNGIRIYNLIVGLFTAFMTYQIARQLKLKMALLAYLFVLIAPIYLLVIFSAYTETTFSAFVILSIYLFFKDKLHWSAMVISFIPIIRSEGIILLPIFALAYFIKKKYWAIPLLSIGYITISLLGWPFHQSLNWIINENPYSINNSIYGSGEWYHFIKYTRYIEGFTLTFFFLVGVYFILKKWLKDGIMTINQNAYIILLILGSFLSFYAAHSYVWWKGMGGSLGLLRVIASVSPLASLVALIGFERLSATFHRYRIIFTIVMLMVLGYTVHDSYKLSKGNFYDSQEGELMKVACQYLKDNQLDTCHTVFYDFRTIFELNKDPYDNKECSWMIGNRSQPSMSIPNHSIVVWEAHFGNNEGAMPLSNLLNDPGLQFLQSFKPNTSFKVLGNHDYEIFLFQKKGINDTSKNKLYTFDFQHESIIKGEDSICYLNLKNQLYSPGLLVIASDLCKRSAYFDIEISFDIKAFQKPLLNDRLYLVLSIEGGENYLYQSMKINEKIIPETNRWQTFKTTYKKIKISPTQEIIKIYLWNEGRNDFLLDNFRIEFIDSEA